MTRIACIYPYLLTEDDGVELRWSLRGLDKYLHLPDAELHPLVVGRAKPTWLDPEHFVLQEDPSTDKDLRLRNVLMNTVAGLRHASTLADVDDYVLYLNDDQILLEHRQDVPQTWLEDTDAIVANMNRINPALAWWGRGMRAAWQWSQRCPVNLRVWEGHRPGWFRISKALPLFEQLLEEPPLQIPFHRTVYGNLVGYPDRPTYPESDLWYIPFGTSWVCLNDGHPSKRRWEHVASRLSEPSRWERS